MHAHFGHLGTRILLYYYYAQSLWPLATLAHSVCTACALGPAQTPPLPFPIASPIPPNMHWLAPVLRGPLRDVEPNLP